MAAACSRAWTIFPHVTPSVALVSQCCCHGAPAYRLFSSNQLVVETNGRSTKTLNISEQYKCQQQHHHQFLRPLFNNSSSTAFCLFFPTVLCYEHAGEEDRAAEEVPQPADGWLPLRGHELVQLLRGRPAARKDLDGQELGSGHGRGQHGQWASPVRTDILNPHRSRIFGGCG